MSNTRYVNNEPLGRLMGLQPGECYEQAEECYTDITMHDWRGESFEVCFDQMAG